MPAQTQEERKADTRARLIAAAADLFARKGFHAVSAEAVADAADRTTGALYSHFGSKDGLLLALVEQWLDESAARISADVEGSSDLDERLRALWSDSMTAEPDDGDAWLLLELELWLHAARNAEFVDDLAQRYAERRSSLAAPLAEWAKDEGLGRLRHPRRTSGLVIALLLGAALQQRLDPEAFSTADVVAGLRALIEGDAS
ncbi:MAG TPA: helix-turn-helix domain-containing protein [Acidimicrobiales bacterium]|jgi:AcrR family transcriptional regulator|nr:helix-turn-helix domain-containing protein [Acidimicrobiales bacterium]